MSGIIAKNVIEDVRARSDIVDIVSAYVQLKQTGSGMKGLCPFHQEKTPSFTVSQQKQIYHCFGCSKGGDVFSFIRDIEHVDFPTSVRMLGEKAGIRMAYDEPGTTKGPAKNQIFSLLAKVTEYFQLCLEEPIGHAAKAYLKQRCLDASSATRFQIGYAPDARGGLSVWAKKQGLDVALLLASGLIAESEHGGSYERFRDRLMFPIHDELARVIGFSGRIMDATKKTAKYVNSPETAVFRKSKVLFGMDKAKVDILELRQAIVCEGQIDVIRCHEAGIRHAVAGQGTALTNQHAHLLHRHADEVVLVLDSDRAGQEAAIRAAEVFLSSGLAVKISALPPGEDPDSLILKQGVDSFRHLINQAKSVIDFQIDILSDRDDIHSEVGQARAAKSVLETIRHADTEVQKEQLLRRAASRLGVSSEALQRDYTRTTKFGSRGLRTTTPPPTPETATHPPEEIGLVELLLHHEEAVGLTKHYLPVHHLSDQRCRSLAQAILEQPEPIEDLDLPQALTGSSLECQRLAAQIQMTRPKALGTEFTAEEAVKGLIVKVWRKALERERAEVRRNIQNAHGAEKDRLSLESSQLTENLSRLRQGWEQALAVIEP